MLPTSCRNFSILSLVLGSAVAGYFSNPAFAKETDSIHGTLLVANKGTNTVSLVDPVTEKQIASVNEDGVTGHELIASPDGKLAYVPVYGNSGVGRPGTDGQLVRVIDLGKREIIATLDFGKGVRPHCPFFNPKNGLLYISTELENSISIVDPKALKVVGSVPTGKPESHMFVLSHDGRRGYTANVASGTVSVLDLEANSLVTVIEAAPRVQRISISPDDRWVVTADQTKLRLVVIDAKTNTASFSIPLPGFAYGTAFTPDGKWLVAALPGTNQVGIIDFAQKRLMQTVAVPKSPQEVLMRPDGAVAYVSCDSSAQVAAIDLTQGKVQKLIDVASGADGLAWAASP